ncbi:MAG: four helix bundle protein [Candidatus Tectomicrobia bacterium]|nr:four helix bundle protein [Candidatus Tectomicrobia bacterium]
MGVHYRSACRANSTDDFIAKMRIVEEDANECRYWLELLVESGLVTEKNSRASWKKVSPWPSSCPPRSTPPGKARHNDNPSKALDFRPLLF